MPLRERFDQKLRALQDNLIQLSEMVCHAAQESVQALKSQDLDRARRVVVYDSELNTLRFRIEEACLNLLATQQPTARDLRLIIAAMNVVLDLERMGDHAANIAKIVIRMQGEPPLKPLIDIPQMADKGCDMLRQALQAYVDMDGQQAKGILARDDEIDQLYNQIFRELLTYMIEDESTVKRAMHLLFVAHNLERIGDRVSNICERVVYLETGVMQELA